MNKHAIEIQIAEFKELATRKGVPGIEQCTWGHCGSPSCVGGHIAATRHWKLSGGTTDRYGTPVMPSKFGDTWDYEGHHAISKYFEIDTCTAYYIIDGDVSTWAYPRAKLSGRQPTYNEVAEMLTWLLHHDGELQGFHNYQLGQEMS